MTKLSIATFSLLALSCGEPDEGADDWVDPRESARAMLIGKWSVMASPNDGTNCVQSYSFDAVGRYEDHYTCELESGAFGVQAFEGMYDVGFGALILDRKAATCAVDPTDLPKVPGFEFLSDGNQLRISFSDVAFLLNRQTDDGSGAGGATFKFGCFDGEVFRARALTPL